MRTLSAVVFLSLSATFANAQDCSVYLSRGIYDWHSSSDALASSSSYSQWFCDQKFSRAQDADSFGATVGFPFKGLPVALGFDEASQSYSSWQSDFCSSTKTNQTLLSNVRDFLKTINQGIVNAVGECLKSDGLHVWLERTDDPKTFLFAGRYNSPIPRDFPSTKITQFDTGPNVKCTEKPKTIGKSEWRTRCSRENEAAVVLVVTTDPGPIVGGGTLFLSPLEKHCQKTYVDGLPYTTQDDTRVTKKVRCPEGQTVVADSGRCLSTVGTGDVTRSEQEGDAWVCEWKPQPVGVGIWASVTCQWCE